MTHCWLRLPTTALALLVVVAATSLTVNMASAQQGGAVSRWGHTATLVDKSVYVLGGKDSQRSFITGSSLVIKLDLSTLRDTEQAAWTTVTPTGATQAPGMVDHVAGASPDNKYLTTYAGATSDLSQSPIWQFDVGASTWQAQTPSGGPPTRRFNAAGAVNGDNLLIYGGVTSGASSSSTTDTTRYRGLFQLGLGNSPAWNELGASTLANGSVYQHTFSYVQGNSFYVAIGGAYGSDGPSDSAEKLVPMDSVAVFRPSSGQWETKKTQGDVPLPRREHSAVVSGKDIIIFGGCNLGYTPYQDLVVLNTDTWTWSKKSPSTPPPARYEHTATLIGNYMLVAFGFLSGNVADSKIYLLNINTWEFTTSFPGFDGSGASSTAGQALSSGAIGGIVGGVAVAVTLIVVVILILLRRSRAKRRRQQDVFQDTEEESKYGNYRPELRASMAQSLPSPTDANDGNAAQAAGITGAAAAGKVIGHHHRVSTYSATGSLGSASPPGSPNVYGQNGALVGNSSIDEVTMASSSAPGAGMYGVGARTGAAAAAAAAAGVGHGSSRPQSPASPMMAPRRPQSPPARYSTASSMTDPSLVPVPVSQRQELSVARQDGAQSPESMMVLPSVNMSEQRFVRDSWLSGDTGSVSGMSIGSRPTPMPHSPTFAGRYTIHEEDHQQAMAHDPLMGSHPQLTDAEQEAQLEALSRERNVYVTSTAPKQPLRIANPDGDDDN